MRRLACVVLVACSEGPTPQTAPAIATQPPPIEAVVHGSHGASIDLLAVTDDGGAAVSQDQAGGTRLWPTLDGSVEPIVVHLPEARELALGRDDTGFTIAALDAAGAVELVRIAATGEVRGRAQIGGEPAILHIAMAPGGLLAQRADQIIVIVAPGGAERGRLVAGAGEQLGGLAVRGGHALALVGDHARRIDGVAWGAVTPALPKSERVAISPDGRRLAAVRQGRVVLVDLATGNFAETMCQAAPQFELDEVEPRVVTRPIGIGFLDDATLACLIDGNVALWGPNDQRIGVDGGSNASAMAVGDRGAVAGMHTQLSLRTRTSSQYLGYGFMAVTEVRVVPGGVLLGKGDQQPLLVDDQLKARRRFTLPLAGQPDDVVALDDRYVVTLRADRLALVDTTRHEVMQELEIPLAAKQIRYEATTHLVATPDRLIRVDPQTMQLGPPTRVGGTRNADLHLVDPALAAGAVAVAIRPGLGYFTVDEIDSELAVRRTYDVHGSVVSVDRAGRVYVATDDVVEVDAFGNDGKVVVARLPVAAAMVRPSPDAAAVAVLADQRIRLFGSDGGLRWEVAAPGASEVGWVGGEPLVRYSGALATLDRATGRIVKRACGWSFGLGGKPLDDVDDNPVCDAE